MPNATQALLVESLVSALANEIASVLHKLYNRMDKMDTEMYNRMDKMEKKQEKLVDKIIKEQTYRIAMMKGQRERQPTFLPESNIPVSSSDSSCSLKEELGPYGG